MGAGASSQTPPRYKWDQDHTLRGPWTFLMKEKVQCACEGSRWCTRENPSRQKSGNALPGLHSNWVGERVLAMARPWQSHVEQYHLVQVFQEAGIEMILNLQEVGEHASCGPGNLPRSGFTYDPESFMAGGVGYYNFAWRDMGVPSLDRMMDIVQVMDYVTSVEKNKIAVHCHAGLGRTGLAIACFFVFTEMHDTPEAAITAVRQNRPGAVQTTRQASFVTIFAQYLQHLRCAFAPPRTPYSHLQGGGSATNLVQGGSNSREGARVDLATRSAPPTAGAIPPSLPTDGLVESKATGSSVMGTYSSGLTVTVPLQAAVSGTPGEIHGGGEYGPDDDPALTKSELGLAANLPWNDAFQIQPQHAADFHPQPPRTYTEALARQARLLHGPERRAFLRLHKVVKEAVFTIIAAAHTFHTTLRFPPRSLITLPSILEEDQSPPQRAKSLTANATSTSFGGYSGGGNGSPHAPSLPHTFAHLLAYLLARHGPHHVDWEALAPLMAHKAYAAAVGPEVDDRGVLGCVSRVKAEINRGKFGGLTSAPLLVVVMVLEGFFANFRGSGTSTSLSPKDPAALTAGCLSAISTCYQDLFSGHTPPPPSSCPSTVDTTALYDAASAAPVAAADAPRCATLDSTTRTAVPTNNDSAGASTAATNAAAATATPAATAASLDHARQAYEILEPLEARDSELLLLFATLLRVVARGSGPGSEDAVVEVGKWAARLVLGKLSSLPEAEEAVLSFLWYLAGRDEAYAMLVLLKRQRMAGLVKRYGAGGADVAAMLQAAAATLAAAVATTAAPLSTPAGSNAGDGSSADASTQMASVHSSIERRVGDSVLPSPGDSNNFQSMSATQLAQLLSLDIQQMYHVAYKDTLAGLPSVVYPPVPSGRIDVHDVWR